MLKDLKNKIKQLERKLKLSQQALTQNSAINKRYAHALNLLKQKGHFTNTVIESNKNAIIAINEKQIVTIFNKSAEEIFGYSKEEMLNKDSLHNIIPSHFFHKHLKAASNFFDTKKSCGAINTHVELEGKRKDGTIFPIRIGFGVEIEKYGIIVVTNIEDITFEKKAQDALRNTNNSLELKTQELQKQYKYLQSIIDGIDDPVMVIDKDYNVTLKNDSANQLINENFIEDINKPKCYEVSHHCSIPCDGSDYPCPLKEVMQTKQNISVVHKHIKKNGKSRYVELVASPLLDNEKKCIGIIESSRDITTYLEIQDELVQQKKVLHTQAYYDELTGLANRSSFNNNLKNAINRAKRNNTAIALFFIDLDRFKEINDSLGHDIGDLVLRMVSKRLKSKIRKSDILYRLGGDEFTIIMQDLKDSKDAIYLAKKIIEVLEQSIIIGANTLYISSSIGISLYPEDAKDALNLLKNADAAMYKAKDEGRNNFKFYSAEMTKIALDKIMMETALRESLKNKNFVVYYQPQINGVDNKLIGMEALVRWRHPTMGLVFPDKFIPLAESTGLIVELDRYVMKTAMTQVAQWYSQGLNPGVLAMNLAVKQVQQEDFIDMFKNLIRETGCEAKYLELEVTEGQIMINPDEAIKILNNISKLGVKLAIDDFGTGYSSLSYLKRLPIDKLKIDQSFIKDLPDDEDDIGITKAVIALSKSLNLRILAEGVETKEQKEFLVKNGCSAIQGYFYAKPMTAGKMEIILINGI